MRMLELGNNINKKNISKKSKKLQIPIDNKNSSVLDKVSLCINSNKNSENGEIDKNTNKEKNADNNEKDIDQNNNFSNDNSISNNENLIYEVSDISLYDIEYNHTYKDDNNISSSIKCEENKFSKIRFLQRKIRMYLFYKRHTFNNLYKLAIHLINVIKFFKFVEFKIYAKKFIYKLLSLNELKEKELNENLIRIKKTGNLLRILHIKL